MNVVIPCAGRGRRFIEAGYKLPKPLIDVKGRPMIKWVVNSLPKSANYIFLVLRDHETQFGISKILKSIVKNCQIVVVDSVTEGAACTVLLAQNLINNRDELIIANSDQYIEWDYDDFYSKVQRADGAILTFFNDHPKWSYARIENDAVIEVAEKKVISNRATVGIYYYRHGIDFVKYAQQMIDKNIRMNNEFYVCPVYNEFINGGKKIIEYPITKMYGFGTPEDLKAFINP